MTQYEMVGIIRPDLEQDAVQATLERIGRRIAEAGGRTDYLDVWGKRRLAYSIQKYREGVYFVTRFTIDNGQLPEIKRLVRIMDEVLRSLVVVAEGPLPVARTTERPERAATERGAEPSRTPEGAPETLEETPVPEGPAQERQ